jgi:hypothetical protein
MKRNGWLCTLLALGLIVPAVMFAAGSTPYGNLLAQVPHPPKDSAAAAKRWLPESSSDSLATGINARLKALQGESAGAVNASTQNMQDVAKQMEGMSPEERMAAAMKLADQMKADNAKTQGQTGQNSYQQMHSELQAGQSLNAAITKATASRKSLDAEYAPQFKKLEDDFMTSFHACPKGSTGDPLKSCSDPLEAKYHNDYVQLADQKLAKVGALLTQLRTDLAPVIAQDEAQIATLEKSSTETAKGQIAEKKLAILSTVQGLVNMTTDAVKEGYDAQNTYMKF